MSKAWVARGPRQRVRATPMQARTDAQDVPNVATRFACSTCQITYYASLGSRPKCPLCDALARIAELQALTTMQSSQLQKLELESVRLRSNVDLTLAMRHALDVSNPGDLAFLKSVLYRFRDDKASIGLRLTHGAARKGQDAPANGFLALPRGLEPEAHVCTSAGGVAIAGYFEEAIRTAGLPYAMTLLMRAVSQRLVGGVPEA